MKALAWFVLVLAGILALGLLVVFLDLLVTGLFTGNPYHYEAMGITFLALSGAAYAGLLALRRIRRQPAPVATSVR